MTALDIRTPAGATELTRVFRVIARVEDAIEAAELATGSDLGSFKAEIPGWIQIAAGLPVHWLQPTNAEKSVPSASIKSLHHLALYLDGKVLVLDTERKATIDALLPEIEKALTAEGISNHLHRYVLSLIAEIRAALADEKVGVAFDLGEAIRRLWICLGAAESEATGESSKGVFRTLREKIIPQVTTNVASSAILAGGTLALSTLF